jgi:flavin reductase (DIM6/NTAB) family NADH-FMN oxidoreductase RutF
MFPDTRQFRDTLSLFATGVAVVATQRGDEVVAMTANAVSSVSLNPMLVMFCPAKTARFADSLPDMRGFSINFLRDEQQALSTYFAGGWKHAPPPPFRFVPALCAPRLEGSLASVACETHHIVDAGDHWLVLGRVLAVHRGIEPHRPLLFFKGQYRLVDHSVAAPAPDLIQTDEPAHIFYHS